MIKVMIVDDQVLLRESLACLLDNEDDIKVIGACGDGAQAVKMCKTKMPDVILMDIEMPQMDGIEATRMIKQNHKDIKVIVLTTFEDPDNIMESFVSNADGYIVKDISHSELILTIRCVMSGLTVIHESVKKIMADRFKGLTEYKSQYQNILTEREVEIVKLIAKGKSNKEIGDALNYSMGTIKNNVSKILEKLDMTDRMQIAIFAMENGIL